MSDLLLHTLRGFIFSNSSFSWHLFTTTPWSSSTEQHQERSKAVIFAKLPHLDIPCQGCSWDEQLTKFTKGWILDYDLCVATVLACLRDFMKSQPVLCLGLLLLWTYASSSDIGLDIIAWTLTSLHFSSMTLSQTSGILTPSVFLFSSVSEFCEHTQRL